jgi:hypothetical protein
MLRHAKTLAPSLTVAALLLGLAAPAFADVPPEPRKRTSRTIEAQHAPPMTPPLEQTPPPEVEAPQPEPAPSQQAPDTAQPTPPQAQPEAKGEAKAAADDKSGSCSIDADSEQTIVGIAALFMLLTSAAFLRRRG